MPNVASSLTEFYDALDSFRRTVEYDPEWTSPCVSAGLSPEDAVEWHAVPMTSAPDFSEIEVQLGTKIHTDVKDFYGSFWSGPIESEHLGEPVFLLGVWNQESLNSTLSEIVCHVISRRQALVGLPDSIFVASTDSDRFFSVNNVTGEVMLEEPGCPPLGPIAPSLSDFIKQLS
jgi:SecY interacting protein Syd